MLHSRPGVRQTPPEAAAQQCEKDLDFALLGATSVVRYVPESRYRVLKPKMAHQQQVLEAKMRAGQHADLQALAAAEPKLAERKRIGLRVMIFLFVLAGLLYFTKKRIWESAH